MELAPQAEPHPFLWADIALEPKVTRVCLQRAHRTMEYHTCHTGGFLRLCTMRGRIYWLAQNEHDHTLPDWKLHFSVLPQHVPLAWNVLSKLFVELACDFGMKAVAEEALADWPERQRGRELTVYIYQHHLAYSDGGLLVANGLCQPGTEHDFWLGPEFERQPIFWNKFVQAAERALADVGVQTRGTAVGDLPLGPYASLRNEAFVPIEGMQRYPPNDAGWNAASHVPPMPLPCSPRCRLAAAACCRRRSRQCLKRKAE